MVALWISHVSVKDEAAFGKYAALTGPAIAKHGGQFLARGGRFIHLEGSGRPRNVVVKFESFRRQRPAINRWIIKRLWSMRRTP